MTIKKFWLFIKSCIHDFLPWWGVLAGMVLFANLSQYTSEQKFLHLTWINSSITWLLVSVILFAIVLSLIRHEEQKSHGFIKTDRRFIFYTGVVLLTGWMVFDFRYILVSVIFISVFYACYRCSSSITPKVADENSKTFSQNDEAIESWKQIEEIREIVGNQQLFKEFERARGSLNLILSRSYLQTQVNPNNTYNEGYISLENSSQVICIDANWGSGKTSLLNIVIGELPEERFARLNFQSWHFGNVDELLHNFFTTLDDFIYSRYGYCLGSDVQKYVKLLTPIVEKGLDFNLESFYADEPLLTIKERLRNMLREVLEKPIVIIIDDLDRMEAEEVMAVLKLVKLLGDFPGLIFVLPFSYVRVSELIVKHHTEAYRDYLQKIINRRIALPQYGYDDLEGILIGRMQNENQVVIIKKIFEEYVLLTNSRRMRDVWNANQDNAGNSIEEGYFDNRFIEFEPLFYKIFPDGDLYHAWTTPKTIDGKEDHEKVRIYRKNMIVTFQGIMRKKNNEVRGVVNDIYEKLIKSYEDYRMGILLFGFYKEIIDDYSAYLSDKLLQNLKSEISHNDSTVNKLRRTEIFDFSINKKYVKQVDSNITSLKNVTKNSQVPLDNIKKIKEIHNRMDASWKEYKKRFHTKNAEMQPKQLIQIWLVRMITARDVVHLATALSSTPNWHEEENWRKVINDLLN